MKVTLKQWLTLEKLVKAANDAITDAWHAALHLAHDTRDAGDAEGSDLLVIKVVHPLEAAREAMIHHSLLHPQSEWMGGNSDDPKNHKLKEPHIVGYVRRYFTPEELKEANAECLGPVQWNFVSEEEQTAARRKSAYEFEEWWKTTGRGYTIERDIAEAAWNAARAK